MKNFTVHMSKAHSIIVRAEDSDTLYDAIMRLSEDEKNNLLQNSTWSIDDIEDGAYVQTQQPRSILEGSDFLSPHAAKPENLMPSTLAANIKKGA